mgnify:CR=1
MSALVVAFGRQSWAVALVSSCGMQLRSCRRLRARYICKLCALLYIRPFARLAVDHPARSWLVAFQPSKFAVVALDCRLSSALHLQTLRVTVHSPFRPTLGTTRTACVLTKCNPVVPSQVPCAGGASAAAFWIRGASLGYCSLIEEWSDCTAANAHDKL